MSFTLLEGQDSLGSQASVPDSIASSQSSFGSFGSIASTASCRGPHKCLAILHGNKGHVISLAMAGDVLYAGSDCGDIKAWEHPDMKEAVKFGCAAGSVKSLVVVGNKLVSAHQDHKIRVWRRSKSQPQVHKLHATLPSVKDYISNFLPPKNYVQVS